MGRGADWTSEMRSTLTYCSSSVGLDASLPRSSSSPKAAAAAAAEQVNKERKMAPPPRPRKRLDGGLVSVDKFTGGYQIYFLTHLHGDRTQGLEAEGGWRHGPLYCSPVTARLLPTRFPGVDASLVKPIAPGEHVSISLSSPNFNSGRPISLHVTAIPAIHCPGSLMYLFRGDLGCRLHTGDFRWELGSAEACSAKKVLLDALAGDTVDVLHLDNTYCHPSIKFPPRHVVAQQIVEIIRAHPDHEVILGVDKLGKEDLLLHIAKELETKIWVWPQRLLTMHLLGIDENQEIFTTQTKLTRVRAVPRYGGLSIESLEALNTTCPTIGIMPSGIPWLWRNSEGKAKFGEYDPSSPPKLFEKDSYTLPYSDHACFAELDAFMQMVRPRKVEAIVDKSTYNVDPVRHFGHLCGDVKKRSRHDAAARNSGAPKRRPSAASLKTPKEEEDDEQELDE